MEQLKAELSVILGESITRLERISEQPYAHLYAMYNRQDQAMPLLAKSYVCQGIAQQEAYKLSMLAREGDIRLPTVYGLVMIHQSPYKEILLIERLRGVSVEAPTRTGDRWNALMDQIVEGILSWHRIDSHGCVGHVESTQENNWYCWYQQRVDVLWAALSNMNAPLMTQADRAVLYRAKASLALLFADFDDSSVLVHGNLTLRSMLKDVRSDQLLAMLNPAQCYGLRVSMICFVLAKRGCQASYCIAISIKHRSLKPSLLAVGFICSGTWWLVLFIQEVWIALYLIMQLGSFSLGWISLLVD